MSEVTKPMALDETLQDVADALDNLTEGYAGESAYEAAVSGGYTMPQSQFEADTQAVRWRSNPNLLDNWYFVGGGDQQGGGQFPINQKRQTVYTTSSYAIDRWRLIVSEFNISTSDGLTLTNASGSTYNPTIRQPIENPGALNGSTVTLSALVKSTTGTLNIGLYKAQGINSGLVSIANIGVSSAGLITTTVVIPSDAISSTYPMLLLQLNGEKGKSVVFSAAKLELGSEQTLAHLENGVWVLNEIPDYTTQLLRCQRFFRVFTGTSTSTTGYGYSTNPKNLRPEMRATPSTGSFTYGGTTYYYLGANL